MYSIEGVGEAHPYKSTGRIYLSAKGREFYKTVAKSLDKNIPWWVESYKPGDWIIVDIWYNFKSNKKFPDVNNLNIGFVNGIMFALQKYNKLIDDAYILPVNHVPKFGESKIEFTLSYLPEALNEERKKHSKRKATSKTLQRS